MAPTYETWQIAGDGLLPMLTDIFIVRRTLDKANHGGSRQPWLRKYLQKAVQFDFVFPTTREEELYKSKPQLTVQDVVATMKLNWELTDYCADLVRQVRGHLTKKNMYLVSYLMGRCTGRRFLEHLASNGPGGSTVLDILTNAWDAMSAANPDHSAADFFSDGFNPQKRHGHQARPMSREQFLCVETLRDTFLISPRPRRVNLKSEKNELRDKREVMKELRKQRGAGPFVAKNTYRILSNFKASPLTTPNFSECGSGARAFLWVWKRLPQRLLLTTNSQDSSDLFNELLKQFATAFRGEFNRKITAASSEQEKAFLRTVRDEATQSLEAAQFCCCEAMKILRWVIARSALYLRRGPRDEHVEDDVEVENETSDVD